MKGMLYGVGVGPGDPELLTLKAVRLIRVNNVIAVPGEDARQTVAYKIAVQAVPELENKKLVPVYMPMTHDKEEMEKNHRKGALVLESFLEKGENVIFLTLGDPTIYSTFTYLQKIVEKDGFQTGLVSGITSFCAAAARMNIPLTEWSEQLHIYPATHGFEEKPEREGTYVLMKAGKKLDQIRKSFEDTKYKVRMIENCGMENERIYEDLDEIPDNAGYYSLIIARKSEKRNRNN